MSDAFVAHEEGMVESVNDMFAARESSLGSYELLEGMIYQTLGPYAAADPSVADVLAEGVAPVLGNTSFPHVLSSLGRTKTVLLTHGDNAFLYGLGSAAKANLDSSENQFVKTLCEALVALRPNRLIVHEFTRLLRSADWSSALMRTLESAGTVVQSSGLTIDVRTAEGRMQWQLLALMADQDRIAIVRRLFGGIVNKHKRGLWLLSPESIPPGYRLIEGRIVLDPIQIEPTRGLIRLLAEEALGCRTLLDEAGRLGCTSLTVQRLYGTDATFADLSRADSKVHSLLDHIAVWETGTYRLRLPNPFAGATSYGQYKVIDARPPENYGFVEFTHSLEVPEGGWGTPELFQAARTRGLSRKQRLAAGPVPATGGAAHRKRRPLAGWPSWTDNTHEFRLSGDSANYLLFRREITEGLPWTADQGRNADRVASIDTDELHRAIVDAASNALRSGAEVEILDGLKFWRTSDLRSSVINETQRKIDRISADTNETRRFYEQARLNANKVDDPELAADLLADAQSHRKRLRTLEADLAELAAVEPNLVPESFASDADFIAHGLAALANCGTRAPAELSEALSQVLRFHSAKCVFDSPAPSVTFSFSLLVPANGQVASFGPIEASVRNRAYLATLKSLPRIENAREALCIRTPNMPAHLAMRDLARALSNLGWTKLAASTLARSGMKSLYSIAFDLLDNHGLTAELDDDYARFVVDIYGSKRFAWNARYHHVDCTERQALIDIAVRSGGSVGHQELTDGAARLGISAATIALSTRDQNFGSAPVWKASLTRAGEWHGSSRRSERFLVAVRCPHCDRFASKAIRVPEIPGGLLCPECRRIPTADSPQFPEEYLRY
jgi:DNA invertase Pin-like site-specific DNA recombinase